MPVELGFEQWHEAGEQFRHRGHAIFYRTGGSGGDAQPLLLVHGFPTASWDWHRVWPALCERFSRVIAPDMIGFGYSAKPRRYRYSIDDQANLHEELLRGLDVERYHVLAHDYGDTVVQELLARQIDRPRAPEPLSVCFLNGGLFPETHRARLIQKALATRAGPLVSALMTEGAFRRSFAATFGPQTRPSREQLSEFWRSIDYNGGRAIFHELIGYVAERREFRERWVGALQKTSVPMRVIDGAVDPVSGAHMVARYRELVPKADTVELPAVGHYPQVEAPEAVLAAFFEFHDRLSRG